MNMLFSIIVVHLATNIIANKEKNKDDEHAIMHIIVLVINMHKKKKIRKNIIPLMLQCVHPLINNNNKKTPKKFLC